MKIDRRITNGLAWAGVLLVIGVPAADLLSAQFSGEAATPAPEQIAMVSPVAPNPAPLSQRPAAKPEAEVAVAEPVAPVVAKPVTPPTIQTATAVDSFLQSGKAMPSYITDAGAVAAKPAPAQVAVTAPARTPIVTTPAAAAPVAVDPMQVAVIAPQKVAPIPMPLSMRPRPFIATSATSAIVLPPELVRQPPATVTAADLDDWETGPLSEFLAKKQGQGGSSATVTSDYDSNGFFLDEGPNPVRRDRVIGWQDQAPLFFAD